MPIGLSNNLQLASLSKLPVMEKLFLCLIRHHAMKVNTRILCFTLRPLYFQSKNREFTLIKGLGGLQRHSRMLQRSFILTELRIEPRFFCLSVRVLVIMQNLFYSLPCMNDLSRNLRTISFFK